MKRREFNQLVVGGLLGAAGLLSPRAARADNTLDAKISRFAIDLGLTPGRTYRARVTVKNVGNLRWAGDDFKLVVENVMSPTGARAQEDEFRFEEKIGEDLMPGQERTLTGELKAPRRSGDWTLAATMTHKGKPFGDEAKQKVDVIASMNAVIDSIRLDKVLVPNKPAEAVVRVRNTGQSIWLPKKVDLHVAVVKVVKGSIGSYRPDWDRHVNLPRMVKPGETVEFKVKVQPKQAGSLTLVFAMWDSEEKDDFGEEQKQDVMIA